MTRVLDRAGRWIETAIYVAGGLLLVGAAVLLLVSVVTIAVGSGGSVETRSLSVLDHVLLIFVLVELFHTVRLAIRTHELDAEPFLVVALIASIRRILVITAGTRPIEQRTTLVEMGLLIVLVIAISAALLLLRRAGPQRFRLPLGADPAGRDAVDR
ncbi:MAG TPA: phosphate-starvation-inducible PsiE family protein [Candidatus Micrarchaeia archaeon]|nr:phosphate-starvation-inducible PsiE family protein [Candidatus Micrarchaeia archaeon]